MSITTAQIQAAQALHAQLPSWKIVYAIIHDAFQNHMANSNLFVVLLKVRLVNRLYFTNIRAELHVAQGIQSEHPTLNALLASGSEQAIASIASCGKGREVRSFASKFAHFHYPQHFPMRDKYVDKALGVLGRYPKQSGDIAKDYKAFRETIVAIQGEVSSVTLQQIDQYLWLKGQKESPPNKLSAEVKSVMSNPAWAQL